METPRGGGEEEPENTAQLWGEVVLLFDVVLEKQSGKGSSVKNRAGIGDARALIRGSYRKLY